MRTRDVPIKYLTTINERTLPEDTRPDAEFKYIDISQVDGTGRLSLPDEAIAFGDAPSRARRIARPGAVIISTVRTYLRAIAQVPDAGAPLVFSTGFAVLEANERIHPPFLYYACRADSFVEQVVARSTGVSYPAINPSELSQIPISLPPLDVQRRVADFLDDQVTRIDNIIAARQEQTASVSALHVAWLSEEHERLGDLYGFARLRYYLRSVGQGWSPQCEDRVPDADEWGVLKAGAVNGGVFRPGELKALPPGVGPRQEFLVKQGDLLVNRASGSLELIGSAAVVGDDLHPRTLLCDKVYRVKLTPELLPNYVAAMWPSKPVRDHIVLSVSGAEGMANSLPSEVIRSVRLPVPPPTVQGQWLDSWAKKTAARDGPIGAVSGSVATLMELKRSLITGAVSGEFDVSSADGSGVAV